jgi:hypothetical protein
MPALNFQRSTWEFVLVTGWWVMIFWYPLLRPAGLNMFFIAQKANLKYIPFLRQKIDMFAIPNSQNYGTMMRLTGSVTFQLPIAFQ